MESPVQPIKKQILFQFLEDTTNKKFNTQTNSGILVVEHKEKQLNSHRWGVVVDVGSDVDTNLINIGDIVLIENLQWTNGFIIEDQKYWLTNEEKILALTDPTDLPEEVAILMQSRVA